MVTEVRRLKAAAYSKQVKSKEDVLHSMKQQLDNQGQKLMSSLEALAFCMSIKKCLLLTVKDTFY